MSHDLSIDRFDELVRNIKFHKGHFEGFYLGRLAFYAVLPGKLLINYWAVPRPDLCVARKPNFDGKNTRSAENGPAANSDQS